MCALRQLAQESKPRTPLSASRRLPSLHAPNPSATAAAPHACQPASWRQEEIEAALQVRAAAAAAAASSRMDRPQRSLVLTLLLAVQACGMHVGQALLALQDPTYRPGDVKAGLQQRRLRSPRAGARRGLSSPRALGEATEWSGRPVATAPASAGPQPKPPSLPLTARGLPSP